MKAVATKLVSTCVLAVAAVAFAAPAAAQFQKPEDAVKYRQSALTVLANSFGRIGAMVNGRAPFDAKVAQDNAHIVATLSTLPWAGFTPNTEALKSRAKPEIWKDAAKFKESSDKMVAEVAKLEAAAKTGNLDSIKVAFGAVGGSCKSCHDAFRTE
ncbi:MAG: cytochrome c [Burkholderiaceae bacterium]